MITNQVEGGEILETLKARTESKDLPEKGRNKMRK